MRTSITQIRFAIIILAVADMLVFAHATGMTLVAMAIGTVTVFLGSFYAYRPASIIGAMTIGGAAAAAIEISSLTETGQLIAGSLGLVVPIFTLTLVSLSAETEESRSMILRKGPVVAVAGYVLVCLLCVPLVALFISLTAPGVSTRLPSIGESAILLVVTIGAAIALTWREPRRARIEAEE